LLGIFLMIASTAVLSAKDGLAKTFVEQVNPVQMIWIQFVGTFVVMSLITIPRHGIRTFTPKPVFGQFIRGALNAVAIVALYWSLIYIPLADATAMFMFAPTIVTLLSPFLLGEKLGIRRATAVGVGFSGVIVILRPDLSGETLGYYIGLLSGILIGLYFIANRKLAGAQPPLLNITHNALLGGLALTPFFQLFWTPVDVENFPKLAAIIALAVVGQALMISAFMFATAVTLAPFSYAFIVFATAIGYFVFGDFPDQITWIGIALIVASGLFIAIREIQLAEIEKRAKAADN
ncbi:MAG: DMT family transporter, partial [Pseudomonadota bacterium]